MQQRSVPLDDIIATPFTVNNSFLEFSLYDAKANLLVSTFFLPSNMKSIEGITDPKITVSIY